MKKPQEPWTEPIVANEPYPESICWRMGVGQYLILDWGDWMETLSVKELREYAKTVPEKFRWEAEEILEEKEEYINNLLNRRIK